MPDNILVFYSSTNSKNKHDATGAFIPEAQAFCKLHDVPKENQIAIECIGVPRRKRKKEVFDVIHNLGAKQSFDGLAFFGHGWPNGIQFGLLRKDVEEFAQLLSMRCTTDVKIVLYACLAAENDVRDRELKNIGPASDGGFADLLRDSMSEWGLLRGWVDAHKTAGHTSWNPYVVRFLCGTSDLQGGAWLVAPRSQYWRDWIKKLKDKPSGLRYRFPFMSELEIKAELAGLFWTSLTPVEAS
jgi:hypothetical protein